MYGLIDMDCILSGLKVLDFSTLLPGPFASLMLADMGAEVVHIESATRLDLVRAMPPYVNKQSTIHRYLNRNKQSIALDLKDAQSIALIKEKIKDYDIVIEQFRPGVMQRLGLDYTSLSALHPALIYCSVTGYGQDGNYQHKAGHDINYLALSGILGYSGRKNECPAPLGVQLADLAGGSLHAIIGILAAVIERTRSGRGQHIDISMTDCVASLNSMAAAAHLAGQQTTTAESSFLNGGSFYDYYSTADGQAISIGGLEPQFLQGLAKVLDLPILLEKGLSPQADDVQLVKQALAEKIASQTMQHWTSIFKHLDLCVEPVLNLEQAMTSELAQQRRWIVAVPDPDTASHEAQLAHPIKYSRSMLRYDFVGQALGTGHW